MKKVTGDIKQYLVMTDICVLSETRVVRGEVLDDNDHTQWNPVVDKIVKDGSFIRAGSIIEKAESQAKPMLNAGVYVNAGETRHFNLEDVFDKQVNFFSASPKEGIPGKKATMADVLRSHSITTLEAVLDNATGYKPLLDGGKKGGNAIKAQDILKLYAKDKDELQLWLEQVQEAIES